MAVAIILHIITVEIPITARIWVIGVNLTNRVSLSVRKNNLFSGTLGSRNEFKLFLIFVNKLQPYYYFKVVILLIGLLIANVAFGRNKFEKFMSCRFLRQFLGWCFANFNQRMPGGNKVLSTSGQ